MGSGIYVVDRESGALREIGTRLHADAEHDDFRWQPPTLEKLDGVGMNRAQLRAEMKAHALFFMDLLHEPAHLRAHDVLERNEIAADDIHFEIACPQ